MLLFPSSRIRTKDLANPALPNDYVAHLSHPAYLAREIASQEGFKPVQSGEAHGVTWKFGPFTFERYVGDDEPVYTDAGPFRLVTWQRLTRKDEPDGWKETHLVMTTSRTGFATVDGDPDYFKKWTSHAQRHRKGWLKKTDWEIVPITMDEYISAFKRSGMDGFLKFLFSNMLKQKVQGHGKNVVIVGARLKGTSAIEGGFVHVDIPEIQQSLHLMSFHTDIAKKNEVGIGLMDYWYQYALQHGIKYLEFGCFWTPGEPNSWKGFSQFKSQFNPQFHDYPRPMMRYMGSKRFRLPFRIPFLNR